MGLTLQIRCDSTECAVFSKHQYMEFLGCSFLQVVHTALNKGFGSSLRLCASASSALNISQDKLQRRGAEIAEKRRNSYSVQVAGAVEAEEGFDSFEQSGACVSEDDIPGDDEGHLGAGVWSTVESELAADSLRSLAHSL